MPIILYDGQIFTHQRFGGISRYFSKLIELIDNSKEFKVLPHNYFSDNVHLHSDRLSKYSILHRISKFRGKARLIHIINRIKETQHKKIIRKGRFDVFHPTYYNDDFLQYFPEKKPFVLTVYDMIHELYYDPYYKIIHRETRQKANLINKAAHIIAISEHTKKDILSLFPDIDPQKISVIHLGYSAPEEYVRVIQEHNPGKYILFVGGRWEYKNFGWMLGALAGFLKANDFFLICAGGGTVTPGEKELIHDLGLDSKVLFQDITDDTFLNGLYRNAFCFIFPSKYEGFGLPILEAFANKTPVILTNATCFPEIAGNAALYFEVDDADSLLSRLNLLFNNNVRNELINEGNSRLKKFSWGKMAEQHTEVYRNVLESSKNANA